MLCENMYAEIATATYRLRAFYLILFLPPAARIAAININPAETLVAMMQNPRRQVRTACEAPPKTDTVSAFCFGLSTMSRSGTARPIFLFFLSDDLAKKTDTMQMKTGAPIGD